MVAPPWHRREPEAFHSLTAAVADEFPSLYFDDRDGTLVLAGELHITEGGRVLDRYEIEVEIPRNGPTSDLPVVREVGGRIPHAAARHVNYDGTCCVAVPDEFWYRNPKGLDLISFLRGPVLNYFIGQSVVETGGPWPYGERKHGAAGMLEFYGAVLGTHDPARARALLLTAAAKKVRAQWLCPCGSGRRVYACHGPRVDELRARLPRRLLRAAADAVGTLRPAPQTRNVEP